MALANPYINYVDELKNLRDVYVSVPPRARLNVIRRRLAQPEIGPTRLVTIVSAVEALARSIAVHARNTAEAEIGSTYATYRYKDPKMLVAEALKLHNFGDPAVYFISDTWLLFGYAVDFRNLVVHECTYLGQDKYPSLIEASEEVLSAMIKLVG